ncbi:YfcC family protein [Carboxylicivirga mesophila]|uniref:YfcC family protein n=1 Tax=Carboxylicivirga mesophila TaxID=1166478 RepID=A0ABS5KGM9_9BACT|nr:AbgT family transporter [Carboxylicivirga mesophila]MBS2213453.1 YfcC family protein [Carboxylicivirga mesophila]
MFKKVPHTYVIIFSLIVLAAVATWFIPGGEYVEQTTVVDGVEQTQMVFQTIDSQPQTWEVFAALVHGFEKGAGIIIFILMIGGAFWIMNDSKAVDVGIFSFLNFVKKLDRYKIIRLLGANNIILILIMLMFSVFGAVFGMSEETIAFMVVLIPLAISMGYDSITGVGIVYLAAHLGFAGAVLNPFTIGIAQGLADLPLFSGFEYRLVCWLIINLVGFSFILWYARKVKKNPKASPVYEEDAYWRKRAATQVEDIDKPTSSAAWWVYVLTSVVLVLFAIKHPETTLKVGGGEGVTWPVMPVMAGLFALTSFLSLRKKVHFFILNLLSFTILFLVIGVMGYEWYITEIAALFLAMGLLSGISMGNDANHITKLFLDGAKDIMSAALVVGLAGGIIVILEEGKIVHTILHALAQSMSDLGNIASVGIMYMIQTLINIVIPSGSAKAALTMPIMAPFSDLIGLSRQATVMAFQFGDGFTNMITPTSPVLIGVLGVAKVPYTKWFKWIAPLIIGLIILGFLLLIPTVVMDLNGF